MSKTSGSFVGFLILIIKFSEVLKNMCVCRCTHIHSFIVSFIHLFIYIFEKTVTQAVFKQPMDDLELWILLISFLKVWHYKCDPPHQFYEVLGIQLRASYLLDKYSKSFKKNCWQALWAPSPEPTAQCQFGVFLRQGVSLCSLLWYN